MIPAYLDEGHSAMPGFDLGGFGSLWPRVGNELKSRLLQLDRRFTRDSIRIPCNVLEMYVVVASDDLSSPAIWPITTSRYPQMTLLNQS